MNIHTKLIGALDAVILSLTAALTIAFLSALLYPAADRTAAVPAPEYAETVRPA